MRPLRHQVRTGLRQRMFHPEALRRDGLAIPPALLGSQPRMKLRRPTAKSVSIEEDGSDMASTMESRRNSGALELASIRPKRWTESQGAIRAVGSSVRRESLFGTQNPMVHLMQQSNSPRSESDDFNQDDFQGDASSGTALGAFQQLDGMIPFESSACDNSTGPSIVRTSSAASVIIEQQQERRS